MTAHPRNLRPDQNRMAAATGCLLGMLAASGPASGQLDPRRGPPGCVPVAERQMERGCYILVSDPLGELPAGLLYWHIDAYPSRALAEAARRPRGTVVEALGKVWLMSVAEAGYRGGWPAADDGGQELHGRVHGRHYDARRGDGRASPSRPGGDPYARRGGVHGDAHGSVHRPPWRSADHRSGRYSTPVDHHRYCGTPLAGARPT
jgi:hypothetical protein